MLKNYKDDLCQWGYITLCDKCVQVVKDNKNRWHTHIHVDKEVNDVPLMETCEACGKEK